MFSGFVFSAAVVAYSLYLSKLKPQVVFLAWETLKLLLF